MFSIYCFFARNIWSDNSITIHNYINKISPLSVTINNCISPSNIDNHSKKTINSSDTTHGHALVNNINNVHYIKEKAIGIRQRIIDIGKYNLLNIQQYNTCNISIMFCEYFNMVDCISNYIEEIWNIISNLFLKRYLEEDPSGKKVNNLIEYIKNFKVIPENAEPADPCLDFYAFLRIKFIKDTYRVFYKTYSEMYPDSPSDLYFKNGYDLMKKIWEEIKQNQDKYKHVATVEQFYEANKNVEKKFGTNNIFGKHSLRFYLKKSKEATAFEGPNSSKKPYALVFAYLSSLYYVINEDQYKIMLDFAITFSDLVINKILLDNDNSSGFSQEAGIIYGRIESFYTYILNYQEI